MSNILVVDDESAIRKALREILEFEDYVVTEAENGIDAIIKVKQKKFDVVILDIKMPKMDGIEALERIQEMSPETPVIMISGHANIDTAVEAVKKGAFDFISKPPDLNRLLITIRNALDKSTLITETKVLKRKVAGRKATQEIIGSTSGIQRIKDTIERVAPTDARVLIAGDNGTGKELVARWLHHKSNRAEFPIIEVNCAAIPSELIESELFGHEKGSFTNAYSKRIGKFELANKGTIFLDEIGDMSLSAQAKVLRALQENRITRVGGDKEIQVDVRVIAASNKDLRKQIEQGKFREDLYHRIAVIILEIPALNQRREDIPELVEHFVNQICRENGSEYKEFTSDAIELLKELNWTGNIRELRNVVERLIILGGKKIGIMDINNYVTPDARPGSLIKDLFSKFEDFESAADYLKKEYEVFKADKSVQ
jgi:DNA-binding NtrC family response regulator